jgi:uncharacterized protein (DUF302 family)
VPYERQWNRHSSQHSVEETLSRLQDILVAKNITIFALVDHSGEAAKVGLAMPPTKLVIFGNPVSGTPLMLAAPSSAIDLPLKILIAEDERGKVMVSYNDPEYVASRHGLPPGLAANTAVIRDLVAAIAK